MNRKARRRSGGNKNIKVLEELNSQDFEYFYYMTENDMVYIYMRTAKDHYYAYIIFKKGEVQDKNIDVSSDSWEQYIVNILQKQIGGMQEFVYHQGAFVFDL